MASRVVIVGAGGQLGWDIAEVFRAHADLVPLRRSDLDITEGRETARLVAALSPDLVINCAALTDVERCERDATRAFEVNALGVKHLVEACNAAGARLLQVSTDFVFDGRAGRPLTERDSPAPLNVYGLSKLWGERFLLRAAPRGYVVRTSGLYGERPNRTKGYNFPELVLRLAEERRVVEIVGDEWCIPTYTRDLARQLTVFLEPRPPGVYHAANTGICSRYDFARRLFDLLGIEKTSLVEVSRTRFPSRARRPPFSVLANERLAALGLHRMPPWEDALRRYLAARGLLSEARDA